MSVLFMSGILGYGYILGMSRVLYIRRRWIGLYCGSEQLNSIADRGLEACVGHALRVHWQVQVFLMAKLILRDLW